MNGKLLAFAAVLAVGALALGPVRAQKFPDRPIKIVVPYPAGGPTDAITRVATQGLGPALGGNVIIENVSGAGGRLGTKDVIRAAPDGYTLLVAGSNEYAITPALYGQLDFDPTKDLVAVASIATDCIAIVVNPSVPVRTLAELAAYTKEHPGKIASGSTVGIVPHLGLMYFKARMGVDMLFVPYKGAAPTITDLLANQIQVGASAKAALLPHILAGKLRALAVSCAQRWPELPDVPTFAESGLTGFPSSVWFGLMAPTGTPPNVIAKINAAESARLQSPEVLAGIAKLGLHDQAMTAEQYATALREEAPVWRRVIAETGVHLQ